MENIGSYSSDYSYIFDELVNTNVNEIRKTAILEHSNAKIATAESVADEIAKAAFNSGGYQFDNSIPENSTFSLHI